MIYLFWNLSKIINKSNNLIKIESSKKMKETFSQYIQLNVQEDLEYHQHSPHLHRINDEIHFVASAAAGPSCL